MVNGSILWDEKNSIEPKKNYENAIELNRSDITINTQTQLNPNECPCIGRVGIVYLLKNNINGKKYIGITTLKLNRRIQQHVADSKNPKYPLHRAIKKYGFENFSVSIIEKVYLSDKNRLITTLNNLEIHYIAIFKTLICFNEGYNLTIGGGVENISEESRKKQSITLIEKYKSAEYRKFTSDAVRKAYVNNPELRVLAGKRTTNRYKNTEERIRMGNLIKDTYIKNPELREKISKIHLELNRNRPELGKLHGQRISGVNHPRFDSNSYTFYNGINTFEGTRYEFYKKYNFKANVISMLINKKIPSYKGWKVKIT